MTTPMIYELTNEQYARIYGCTARSVSNYGRDEAPLDEPEAMYHWLWKRRTQPAGFTGKSVDDLIRAYASVAGNAEAREEVLCEEISDTLFEIDVRQLIIRCKLLAADKDGCPPRFAARAKDALSAMLDQINVLYALVGTNRDDRWDDGQADETDDDSESESDDEIPPGHILISRKLESAPHADNIVPLPIQSAGAVAPASVRQNIL